MTLSTTPRSLQSAENVNVTEDNSDDIALLSEPDDEAEKSDVKDSDTDVTDEDGEERGSESDPNSDSLNSQSDIDDELNATTVSLLPGGI